MRILWASVEALLRGPVPHRTQENIMQIKLITLGHKTPNWVKTGFQEYQQRLPAEFKLELLELPLKNHGKLPVEESKKLEGNLLLKAVKAQDFCIAMDEHGKELSTLILANKLEHWHNEYRNITILVGGPSGLSSECLKRANFIWSLSPLTFPHQLIKIIVAEQLYRAVSILNHHPYHRE
jgi:23S rRNA (pseudouridine1915-N3)-methyltransferase